MNQIKYEQVKELYLRASASLISQLFIVSVLFCYYNYAFGPNIGYITCFVVFIFFLLARYNQIKKYSQVIHAKQEDYIIEKAHTVFTVLVVPLGIL